MATVTIRTNPQWLADLRSWRPLLPMLNSVWECSQTILNLPGDKKPLFYTMATVRLKGRRLIWSRTIAVHTKMKGVISLMFPDRHITPPSLWKCVTNKSSDGGRVLTWTWTWMGINAVSLLTLLSAEAQRFSLIAIRDWHTVVCLSVLFFLFHSLINCLSFSPRKDSDCCEISHKRILLPCCLF